ncbi:MAG TPA: hypothetical protein VNK23_03420, partial [Candidatus Dormibacteraeota bacterium]|nr:hypothetical protein [Candidatus Dormibacteraeota bacterium]
MSRGRASFVRRALAIGGVFACICMGIASGVAFGARGDSRSSVFAPDHGKFKIMVSGVQAGEESFDVSRDGDNWVAHGSTEIHGSDGVTRVTGKLVLHPDGSPVRYDWSTVGGANKAAAAITFNGPTATIVLHGKRPYTQQFTFGSPNIAVLDNNLYDQFGILARLYDWQKQGEQTFPVLIPQELTPG